MPERKITDLIGAHLKPGSGRILLIEGARQAGKTDTAPQFSCAPIIAFTGKKKWLKCAVNGELALIFEAFSGIITDEIRKGRIDP